MASGKQQSFQYGEVSPSLRYMSDAVSYSTGLAKLRNMYVRRTGGISNRSGFESVKVADSQYAIPEVGGKKGAKGFTYWAPYLKEWVTLEVYKYAEDPISSVPENIGLVIDGFSPVSIYTPNTYAGKTELEELRFTLFDDSMFITPGIKTSYTGNTEGWVDQNYSLAYGLKKGVITPYLTIPTGVFYSGFVTQSSSCQGGGPYFPVSYLITGTFNDGQEVAICQRTNVGTAGVGGLAYPTATVQNTITVVLDSSLSQDLKFLNLYRASGKEGISTSMYSLVGRQKYAKTNVISISGRVSSALANGITNIASTTGIAVGDELLPNPYFPKGTKVTVVGANSLTLSNYWSTYLIPLTDSFTLVRNPTIFNDFGATDASITPPIDSSFMGIEISLPSSPDTIPQLCGGSVAAYYQQRAIIALRPGVTEATKVGTILVSKIGAPKQLKSPIIFSNTEAFTISLPITDGTPCVALLSMERLMAFTSRGVYIIRGGEQGILTPTEINPLLVSEEGCSSTVEPKMAGKRGYFINAAHTKLMSIVFGSDGNISIEEASITSPELLAEDITDLEIITDTENTVYLLRRDGKLVRITSTEEGVHGFAVIETKGYIESIFRGKNKKPYVHNYANTEAKDRYYDVLMCYVIRNGSRILERLNIREDAYKEGEMYADCGFSFGMRLSENGSKGFIKVGTSNTDATRINLKAANWTAGNTIEMWCSNYINTDQATVLNFYYSDDLGKTQILRFNKQVNTIGVTGLLNTEATRVIGDLTFTSASGGYADADRKNDIEIEYLSGGIAGSEAVTVTSYKIQIRIQVGVSTATQILAKLYASIDVFDWVTVAITGTGATAQDFQGSAKLQGGFANYTVKYTGYSDVDIPTALRDVVAQEVAGTITEYERNKRVTSWLPTSNTANSFAGNDGLRYALSSPLELGIGGDFTGTPLVPSNKITNLLGNKKEISVGSLLRVAGYPDIVTVTAITSTELITDTNFTHSEVASVGITILYPVSVFADGEVVSSPLNPNKPVVYLEKFWDSEFIISLPDYYAWGYVGLPYTSEMETLDLETAGERTLTDANKLINSVGTAFLNTRGGFIGMQEQSLENMQEIVVREDEDFSNKTENFNGHIVTHIPAEWNEKGRINIKQVDPAPITVLSVYPKGISGD